MSDVRGPGWGDVVCVAPDKLSSPIGDDVVILEMDEGVYYGLNATGARIWELLQKPVRVSDVHATLVAEFAVEEDAARADLLAVLGQLRGAGLIEVRGEGAP